MDESYIICNNALKPYPKEGKIGERNASLKSGLAIPLYPGTAGGLKILIISYLPWSLSSNGRAMREYGRLPQCYWGSTVKQ